MKFIRLVFAMPFLMLGAAITIVGLAISGTKNGDEIAGALDRSIEKLKKFTNEKGKNTYED